MHQTRAHFFKKYGYIVDNPNVGRDLTEMYWRPGNGASFLDLVEGLTGSPLTGDAWVSGASRSLFGFRYMALQWVGPRTLPCRAQHWVVRTLFGRCDDLRRPRGGAGFSLCSPLRVTNATRHGAGHFAGEAR